MKKLNDYIINIFCPDYYETKRLKELYEEEKNQLALTLSELNLDLDNCNSADTLRLAQIIDLQNKLDKLQSQKEIVTEDPLETFWNNKRPKVTKYYPARCVFDADGNFVGQAEVDPRHFIHPRTKGLPTFKGKNDDIVIKALDWMIKKFTYKSESKELWQYSFESLLRMIGDCDDGAILLNDILLASGVPYWRVRLNAGDVMGGGHKYVTYLAEKDNEWYVLDWCYWPEESRNLKLSWKTAKNYYVETDGKKGFGIWFSYNQLYIFEDLPKT